MSSLKLTFVSSKDGLYFCILASISSMIGLKQSTCIHILNNFAQITKDQLGECLTRDCWLFSHSSDCNEDPKMDNRLYQQLSTG